MSTGQHSFFARTNILWRHVHAKKADETLITKTHIQDMEILVKILSIGELREIPLTQTDGSVKLLAKILEQGNLTTFRLFH